VLYRRALCFLRSQWIPRSALQYPEIVEAKNRPGIMKTRPIQEAGIERIPSDLLESFE